MRKILIMSLGLFAAAAFAVTAHAGGGCDWGGDVATTTTPVVTADSGTTAPQTPMPTKPKTGGS